MQVTTIGIDLAKNVFQVHGIDEAGKVVVRRALRRKEVLVFFGKIEACLVGIEACAITHPYRRRGALWC
jgi:transposase